MSKTGRLFREQAFIGGEWSNADSGETFDVFNPSTGERIGSVPKMGTTETRRAIEAAAAAWPQWRSMLAKERAAILMRWRDLIIENVDELASILTLEQGKSLAESKGETLLGAIYIEWFAEECKRVYGEIIPPTLGGRKSIVMKEPVGVCAAITPWNFPNAMITRKCGPALAAGCPIVVKPAEDTPYTALALAALLEEAGAPKGVLSIVTGIPAEIGGEMTSNSTVRKLSFTGSTPVGKLLLAQCAQTVKRVSMELGGNAPLLVFDDADLDEAVEGTFMSKFRNAGQTCVCSNRIFVQEGIYDAFIEKFTARVKKLTVGDGFDSSVTQGPLINKAAVNKVDSHVQDALSKGGRLMTGGRRMELGECFYEPTVVADLSRESTVFSEETFGPFAPIFRFKTEEEGVALANDTPFGLAAYFFSRDVGRIWRVSEALEAGMISCNVGVFTNEASPFGGYKESGIGRESAHFGIDEYLEIKYICMGGL